MQRNIEDSLARLKRRVRGWLEIRIEKRQLAALPSTNVRTNALRRLNADELLEMLSPTGRRDTEWQAAAREIDRVVVIKDQTTEGVNPGDRRAIFYLIRALKPKTVLEIGTNVGASTMHIALAQKLNGIESRLVTVDQFDVNDDPNAYWKRGGLPRSPRDNIAALGMKDRVEFIQSDSISYLGSSEECFDFIFLDGAHTAAILFREIPLALEKLNPGGLILLHDFFPKHSPLWSDGSVFPGPKLATDRIQKEGADITVLPLGQLRWPTKLGSNVTSLAVVARAGS